LPQKLHCALTFVEVFYTLLLFQLTIKSYEKSQCNTEGMWMVIMKLPFPREESASRQKLGRFLHSMPRSHWTAAAADRPEQVQWKCKSRLLVVLVLVLVSVSVSVSVLVLMQVVLIYVRFWVVYDHVLGWLQVF
jgi:hypothetical protein